MDTPTNGFYFRIVLENIKIHIEAVKLLVAAMQFADAVVLSLFCLDRTAPVCPGCRVMLNDQNDNAKMLKEQVE
jgi:hypothetical protein